MAGRWDGFHGLPHGWEVRFDGRIGRYYFIDHINKKTSWEDPRLRSAPPPPPHPDTLPPEQKIQQESQSQSNHPSVSQATESALSKKGIGGVQTTDEAGLLEAVEHSQLAIAKISAMFPTVPESHIKELMRKYHNREAVVISALQVQKHPLATPGPYGTFTPPPMRHFIPTATALMALQSTKSSIGVTSASSSIGVTSTTTTTTTTTQDKSKVTTTTGNGTSVGASVTTVPVVTSSKIDHPLHHPVHERAKGTHALEDKKDKNRQSPMAGRQGSLERSTGSPFRGRGSVDKSAGSPRLRQGSVERSIGSPFFGRDSPLMSSRASSPHTFLDGSPRPTTRSISEFTRSLMGSPRMDYRYSPRPTPHSPKIKLRGC